MIRSGRAARVGALLLVAGPILAWAAELITAAAWQDPHYAPLYNWVSHLGLTSTLVEQHDLKCLGVETLVAA